MIFILYFIRILPQKGFKIPGNGLISTKMHGISFASGAPPQTPLRGRGGAHIAPNAVYRGIAERVRARLRRRGRQSCTGLAPSRATSELAVVQLIRRRGGVWTRRATRS